MSQSAFAALGMHLPSPKRSSNNKHAFQLSASTELAKQLSHVAKVGKRIGEAEHKAEDEFLQRLNKGKVTKHNRLINDAVSDYKRQVGRIRSAEEQQAHEMEERLRRGKHKKSQHGDAQQQQMLNANFEELFWEQLTDELKMMIMAVEQEYQNLSGLDHQILQALVDKDVEGAVHFLGENIHANLSYITELRNRAADMMNGGIIDGDFDVEMREIERQVTILELNNHIYANLINRMQEAEQLSSTDVDGSEYRNNIDNILNAEQVNPSPTVMALQQEFPNLSELDLQILHTLETLDVEHALLFLSEQIQANATFIGELRNRAAELINAGMTEGEYELELKEIEQQIAILDANTQFCYNLVHEMQEAERVATGADGQPQPLAAHINAAEAAIAKAQKSGQSVQVDLLAVLRELSESEAAIYLAKRAEEDKAEAEMLLRLLKKKKLKMDDAKRAELEARAQQLLNASDMYEKMLSSCFDDERKKQMLLDMEEKLAYEKMMEKINARKRRGQQAGKDGQETDGVYGGDIGSLNVLGQPSSTDTIEGHSGVTDEAVMATLMMIAADHCDINPEELAKMSPDEIAVKLAEKGLDINFMQMLSQWTEQQAAIQLRSKFAQDQAEIEMLQRLLKKNKKLTDNERREIEKRVQQLAEHSAMCAQMLDELFNSEERRNKKLSNLEQDAEAEMRRRMALRMKKKLDGDAAGGTNFFEDGQTNEDNAEDFDKSTLYDTDSDGSSDSDGDRDTESNDDEDEDTYSGDDNDEHAGEEEEDEASEDESAEVEIDANGNIIKKRKKNKKKGKRKKKKSKKEIEQQKTEDALLLLQVRRSFTNLFHRLVSYWYWTCRNCDRDYFYTTAACQHCDPNLLAVNKYKVNDSTDNSDENSNKGKISSVFNFFSKKKGKKNNDTVKEVEEKSQEAIVDTNDVPSPPSIHRILSPMKVLALHRMIHLCNCSETLVYALQPQLGPCTEANFTEYCEVLMKQCCNEQQTHWDRHLTSTYVDVFVK